MKNGDTICMIKTKDELVYYLKCDKVALMVPENKKWPSLFDYVWKYEIALRKAEYYSNRRNLIQKTMYLYWYYKFKKLGFKLNIEIWLNQFGPAAIIGDNVFIGSGAKIIGEVTIANNIAIGAGAVVTKSFSEDNITIAGVPAKIISHKGSEKNLIKATEIVKNK